MEPRSAVFWGTSKSARASTASPLRVRSQARDVACVETLCLTIGNRSSILASETAAGDAQNGAELRSTGPNEQPRICYCKTFTQERPSGFPVTPDSRDLGWQVGFWNWARKFTVLRLNRLLLHHSLIRSSWETEFRMK